MAHIHKMATAISESAMNKGMISWTGCTGAAGLESTEDLELEMLASCTDNNEGSMSSIA